MSMLSLIANVACAVRAKNLEARSVRRKAGGGKRKVEGVRREAEDGERSRTVFQSDSLSVGKTKVKEG
jgi:hypothetical protein